MKKKMKKGKKFNPKAYQKQKNKTFKLAKSEDMGNR